MLFLSEEERNLQRRKLAAAMEGDREQEARHLVQLMPDFAMGWMLLGAASTDPAESLAALWKALSLEPFRASHYLNLADHLTESDPADALAKELRALALWKLALSQEVDKLLGKHFETIMGAEAWEPESYEVLAEAQERENAKWPRPAAIRARLRPYYLLNKLQQQALDAMEPSTLREILNAREECEPLFRNALRQWARSDNLVDDETVSRLVVILGEISGPDFAEELMEVINWGDMKMFVHIQWSLQRLAQRHPAPVLEVFRKLAAGDLVARAAIAEQLVVMNPVIGDVEVLTSVLDGFDNFVRESGAPFVISAVVSALRDRGETSQARSLAERYMPGLNRKGREIVRGSLAGDYVPMLKKMGLLDLTLDDICVGGALMGDEEEEVLEEDELEEEVDLAPPPKPGRNEPCWCGSGKKYKKCHLAEDEKAAREKEAPFPPDAPQSLHRIVSDKLFKAATSPEHESDLRRAKKMYFGESGEIHADEDEMDGFVQWLLYDFRDSATRSTVIETYLRIHANIPPAERSLLESLRDARFGLFEVLRVEPGSGVEIRDIFGGDPIFIHDISSSHEMHRWDCLLARPQFYQGRWIFAGNGTLVPRNLLQNLREFIERESLAARQSPADFVRANSHQLHRVVRKLYDRQLSGLRLVNNEGEEVSFGKAEYTVSDPAALLAKLRAVEELEEGKPDASGNPWFTWIQPMGEEHRPLGHLEIEGGTLRLEAMSRTRLATLRGLAEAHAGELIRHRGDHYTSVDEIKERVRRGETSPETTAPPSPEVQAALAAVLAKHYENWVDEKLPALGGKTARQAMRSKTGRQSVIDLLRMMENSEQRKKNEPVYDFNIIRRQLGLPEE